MQGIALPHCCRLLLATGPSMSCPLQAHFAFIFASAEVQGDFHHKPALLFPFLLARNCRCCFVSFLYLCVMYLGLHLISPYESPSSGYPLFVSFLGKKFFSPYVRLSSIDLVSWMPDYAAFTTMKKIMRANAFVITN